MSRVVSAARTYSFQNREVKLPVVVRRAASANATYVVPARAAQALLGQGDLAVAEIAPGRTLFSIAAIDYQDNDLGDYNEVSLALFVREARDRPAIPYLSNVAAFFRGALPTYIHRLPVDQSFTCDAGRGIWGFPKTIEHIDFVHEDGSATCKLTCDGVHVLTLTVATGGKQTLPQRSMTTYSRLDGVTHKTEFVSGAEQVGFRLGGAELILGNHPIAAELASLGLPKSALLSVWMGNMYGRFEAPAPI